MLRESRRLEDYRATSLFVITPVRLNPQDTVFGGEIASRVDELAAFIAKEYACTEIVATRAMYVPFEKPAYKGEVVKMEAQLLCVEDTSMGILVDATAKNHATGEERKISRCYLTFIAKDKDGNLIHLPRPDITEEGRKLYEKGKRLKEKSKELNELLYS